MYGATLSYAQLKEYLPELEKSGLIAHDTTTQLYHLTQKGMHFLNSFNEIDELLIDEHPGAVREEIRPVAKTTILGTR